MRADVLTSVCQVANAGKVPATIGPTMTDAACVIGAGIDINLAVLREILCQQISDLEALRASDNTVLHKPMQNPKVSADAVRTPQAHDCAVSLSKIS